MSLQAAPFLSALDELVKGMANSLDERVFVGVSRGVWDCVGQAISDSLSSLEDGGAAQVLLSRQPRLSRRVCTRFWPAQTSSYL